ncbi:Protein GPR107 [Manis javanica]|nr:Protein GPR107 [Manis javanica]
MPGPSAFPLVISSATLYLPSCRSRCLPAQESPAKEAHPYSLAVTDSVTEKVENNSFLFLPEEFQGFSVSSRTSQ